MKEVKDRVVEFPNRFELINTANGMSVGVFDLKDIAGAITEQGTPIDAELFDSIDDDILACVAVMELDGDKLILKNKDGVKLGEVDLSKLTFDIELKNYYTKAETDTITGGIAAEIDAETARATGVEANIASDLSGEIGRATGAESAIAEDLTGEITRAKGAEQTNANAITAEVTRAQTVEGNISEEVDGLRKNITAEKKRAEEAEQLLSGDIAAEETRAGNAENALRTDLTAETERATAAEKANADSIAAEKSRATGVESSLSESLTAEVGRATAAENALSDRVTTAQNTADTAESIARGRAQARVFDTVADMNTWLANPDNVAVLNIGDNLYIKAVDVPDYWWDGTSAQRLETEKPDLTEYYKKSETDTLVETAQSGAESYADGIVTTEKERAEQEESYLSGQVELLRAQKYTKPLGGILKSDLSSDVQYSLGRADTALQSFTETDPTVPAWAKAAKKPTYTAAEVGAATEEIGNKNLYNLGVFDTYTSNGDGTGTVSRKTGYAIAKYLDIRYSDDYNVVFGTLPDDCVSPPTPADVVMNFEYDDVQSTGTLVFRPNDVTNTEQAKEKYATLIVQYKRATEYQYTEKVIENQPVHNVCPIPVGLHHIQFPNEPKPENIWAGTKWEIDTTMQGRVPIGSGGSYVFGAKGGEATHTLMVEEMPSHSHDLIYDTVGATGGEAWVISIPPYSSKVVRTQNAGAGQPFNIMQPYVVVNYWKRTA